MDKQLSLLTEALKKATGLADLFESEAFQENIVPLLDKASHVEFIDPTLHDSHEKYQHLLDAANVRAGAYAEFYRLLKNQRQTAESLIKQIETINKKKEYESGKI